MLTRLATQRLVAVGLCAATAGLCWLSVPPVGLWPLGLVAFAPLLIAVRRASTLRSAALLGFLCWLATVIGVCWWLAPTMQRFAGGFRALGLLGLGAYAAWEGLRLGLACALWRFASGPPEQEPLRFALALVTLDMVWPQVFPWPFGIVVAEGLLFSQLAVLGGSTTLTALVGMSNGLVAALLVWGIRSFGARSARWIAAYGVVLAFGAGFGFFRLSEHGPNVDGEPAGSFRVALVQGGADPETKRQKPRELLRRYAETARAMQSQLVIGPELVAGPRVGSGRGLGFGSGGDGAQIRKVG